MTDVAAAPAKQKTAKQAEAAAPAPAAPVVQKTMREQQPPTLKPSEFEESQYAFLDVSAKVPAGIAFEDVLRPTYWTNVVQIFKRDKLAGGTDRAGAFIHVRTEDHAFYAKLYVRAVLERGLIVQCVGPSVDPETGKACPIDLATGGPWVGQTALDTAAFDLKWNATKRGFDIIRKSDQQVVADGSSFPTRELAVEWINKTAKAH